MEEIIEFLTCCLRRRTVKGLTVNMADFARHFRAKRSILGKVENSLGPNRGQLVG